MKVLRVFIAAVLAATVTFGLFALMQQLISSPGRERVSLGAIARIHFGPLEIPREIANKSRIKPARPPPPKDPPPPPKMHISTVERQVMNMPVMNMPDLDLPLVSGEGLFPVNFQQVDQTAEGDIIPLLVIRPIYPRDAAMAGIEGWVKIEFTITGDGAVINPRVVDARPARVFNRAAIRAILKWKFKPRVIAGAAVKRQASQVIDFKLDGAAR